MFVVFLCNMQIHDLCNLYIAGILNNYIKRGITSLYRMIYISKCVSWDFAIRKIVFTFAA